MKDISNPILAEYALYLEKQKMEYLTNNGFSVRFELKNADVAFIDVRITGKLLHYLITSAPVIPAFATQTELQKF